MVFFEEKKFLFKKKDKFVEKLVMLKEKKK